MKHYGANPLRGGKGEMIIREDVKKALVAWLEVFKRKATPGEKAKIAKVISELGEPIDAPNG